MSEGRTTLKASPPEWRLAIGRAMGLVTPLPAIYMAGVLAGDANICRGRTLEVPCPPPPGRRAPRGSPSRSPPAPKRPLVSKLLCLQSAGPGVEASGHLPGPPSTADAVWSTLSPTASIGASTCY